MAILSISSEYGTGALRIGHAIEEQLGYEYIPLRGSFGGRASGKKWERLAAKYSVDPSDIWEGNDFVAFMALVQSVILGHAMRDNVVILARGSNFLLKGVPHALRVRFTAPLEERIAMVVKEGSGQPGDGAAFGQAGRPGDRLLDAPGLRPGLGRCGRPRDPLRHGRPVARRDRRDRAQPAEGQGCAENAGGAGDHSEGSLQPRGSRPPCWPIRR